MGRKSKLKRFAEVASFPNVFEVDPTQPHGLSHDGGESHDLRGNWAEGHFKNEHPVILELACGKGDYTVALARECRDRNYVGVDIKGARIWKGARTALEEGLLNVAFLRTRIEFIDRFFAPAEVAEIWITFPDPFEGKPNRRLTAPPFLDRYRHLLQPGGIIHLKTDATMLYEYTLEVIQADPRCHLLYANADVYSRSLEYPELAHKTYYELKHIANGRRIKYLRFTIGGD